MPSDGSPSPEFLCDTGPLIYLVKIDAIEVFAAFGTAWIPPAVRREAILPPAAFRFPEIVAIEAAIERGDVRVTALSASEEARAASLGERAPGLGTGEREAIAVAAERRWPVVLVDRRARRIAGSLGLNVLDAFELLFQGTADPDLLDARVRALAALVELRIGPLTALLERVEGRR